MLQVKGGCACGAVRYQSAAAPKYAVQCQCRACQRSSGIGHASQVMVPTEGFEVTGEVRFYQQPSDSGNTIARGFCPACGSPLFNTISGYPNVRGVHVGSLDDPGGFRPQQVVWHGEAQPWDFLDPEVPTGGDVTTAWPSMLQRPGQLGFRLRWKSLCWYPFAFA